MHISTQKRLTQAEVLCKEAGARLTPIRKDLLTIFYDHDEHLSAYELLRLLRNIYPKAEAMTVYRALDFLQKHQLIHRVASQNAYTACDTPQQQHHPQLLLCESCGQAEEISSIALQKAVQNTVRQYGFTLSDKPIEMIGLCKNCGNTKG